MATASGSSGSGRDRPDQGLKRSQRITQPGRFQQAYSQGHKTVGQYMVMWLLNSDNPSLKLGVVASRKVGNAVRRAKARRRLREVFRQNRYQLQPKADVVLVARASIIEADWADIEKDFFKITRKAGLFPAS